MDVKTSDPRERRSVWFSREELENWRAKVSRRWDRLLTPSDLDPATFPAIDVESVSTYSQWREVLAFRAERYGIPLEKAIDADDSRSDSYVLIARLAVDGSIVGTCRVSVSDRVSVCEFVEIPNRWTTDVSGAPAKMAEVRKLAIYGGNRLTQAVTKLVLWSCAVSIAEEAEASWILVAVREALVPDYRLFLCEQADPPVLFTPPDVPHLHEVLALEVVTARSKWHARGSRTFEFLAQGPRISLRDSIFRPYIKE